MKHVALGLLCFLIGWVEVSAQRPLKGDGTLARAERLEIDGILSDWGDSLGNEDTKQSVQYELRNDDKFLFVAMRVTDLDRQTRAIAQGIRFMVNADGRKRQGPALIYPLADRIAFKGIMSEDQEDRPDDFRIGGLRAVRGIFVSDFENLLDGMVSLENHYGISAGSRIDTSNALCVELRIPLALLNIADTRNELAYNIRIGGAVASPGARASNTHVPQRPYPGYGYPYYGGMYGGGSSRVREETGLWGKFRLAPYTETAIR